MPPLAAFPKGFFDAIVERRMTVFQWIDHAGDLELPMFCNSPDFTQPDPADRKKEVERTREMFRVTAELGGKFCRVLSGQNRPGLNEAEALKWVIDSLWALE